MKIHIVTPTKNIVEDDADEVYAVGPRGEFGILPGHAHYVTPLEVGRLYYLKNGKKHAFVVTGGFLEVHADRVQVLADQVEPASSIDVAAARKRLEVLEKKLAQGEIAPEEFYQAMMEQRFEQARIAAAS